MNLRIVWKQAQRPRTNLDPVGMIQPTTSVLKANYKIRRFDPITPVKSPS